MLVSHLAFLLGARRGSGRCTALFQWQEYICPQLAGFAEGVGDGRVGKRGAGGGLELGDKVGQGEGFEYGLGGGRVVCRGGDVDVEVVVSWLVWGLLAG